MGICSILPFVQYFFKDIIKKGSPALWSSISLAILILMSIPANFVSGHFSDKYGRKTMVYISTAILGVGCGLFSIVSFFPNLGAVIAIAVILGIGYGIYTAVDWALVLDSIPEGQDVAKYMGLWHIAVVLPSVIGPVISGAILDVVKERNGAPAAYCTLFASIFGWFLLAFITIYPVVETRGPRSKPTKE